MDTTRRRFLFALPALVAGTRTYFDIGPSVALGAEGGWNTLLTPEWLAKELLQALKNNLTFAKSVERTFGAGDTLKLRTPPRFAGHMGDGLRYANQRQYNAIVSAQVEQAALAPKAPFMMRGEEQVPWDEEIVLQHVKTGDVITFKGRNLVNPAPVYSSSELAVDNETVERIYGDMQQKLADAIDKDGVERGIVDAIDAQRPFVSDEAISASAQSIADDIDARGLELFYSFYSKSGPLVMSEKFNDREWRGLVDLVKRRT